MNSGGAMDEKTLTIGLLMESAQTQQRMAEEHLSRLSAHVQGLDSVVRGEIRQTLIEELTLLNAEINGTVRALHRVRRSFNWRSALYSIAIALACALAPLAAAHWLLPSTEELAALQARRRELSANISALKLQGASLEFRHCGNAQRLCVRVDTSAPKYGQDADFYVAHGY
jgi:hypothetical protein